MKAKVYTISWEGDELAEHFGCKVYATKKKMQADLLEMLLSHNEVRNHQSIEGLDVSVISVEMLHNIVSRDELIEATYKVEEHVIDISQCEVVDAFSNPSE